jgi:uncharacterized protein (TIGR02444 family)
MNPPRTEEFWRFSLQTYARSTVSALCIELQDRDGRDVNILLLALFAGLVLGRRLAAEDFAALDAATAPWRDRITQKLRAVRRDLKSWTGDPAAQALRRAVEAAEIEAERLAQRQLLAALPAGPVEAPGQDLACANLRVYAGTAAEALAAAVA